MSTDLHLDIEAVSCVQLAMAKANHDFFHSISLEYKGSKTLHKTKLLVSCSPEFAKSSSIELGSLAQGTYLRVQPSDIRSKLSEAFLSSRNAMEDGVIVCTVVDENGQPLARKEKEVTLLGVEQWSGLQTPPELLTEFIQPDSPRLGPWFELLVWRYQQQHGGVHLPDPYSSRRGDQALLLAELLYNTIRASPLKLVAGSESFDAYQDVRTGATLLEHGEASSLEVAVLAATLLEKCKLNPLIVFTKNATAVGLWLKDHQFASPWTDDLRPLEQHREAGELILFDPGFALLNREFSDAQRSAESLLGSNATFLFGLDVKRARLERSEDESSGEAVTWPDRDESLDQNLGTLDRWKERLLDLTLRNRLLNYKETKKVLTLATTDLANLEDCLIREGSLELKPQPKAGSLEIPLESHANSSLNDGEVVTSLKPAPFQKRATELFRFSQALLKDTGSCPLYLSLGMVRWFESESSGVERLAPLLLMPVRLVRVRVGGPFKIEPADEDPMMNVTLLKKFERDFGLDGSDFSVLPEDDNGIDVKLIIERIEKYLEPMPRFEVLPQASIAIFEFRKFLMWLDLEQNQELLKKDSVVRYILDRDIEVPTPAAFAEPARLDTTLKRHRDLSVMECDSSQLAAVVSALDGNSFVLQGPPGTGKSQTITNLIAQALGQGKTVLFVSEKRAALEVVEERLKSVKLDAFTLEAHSEQGSKQEIIRQLEAPFLLDWPKGAGSWERLSSEIEEKRRQLNSYIQQIHEPGPFGESLYDVVSKLTSLRDVPFIQLKRVPPNIETLSNWQKKLEDAVRALDGLGPLQSHPWRQVQKNDWTAAWQRDVEDALENLQTAGARLEQSLEPLRAHVLQVDKVPPLKSWDSLVPALEQLLKSPSPPPQLLEHPYTHLAESIERISGELKAYSHEREAFSSTFKPTATEKIAIEQELAQLEKWAGAFFILAFFMLFGTRRRIQPHLVDQDLPSNEALIEALSSTVKMLEQGSVLDSEPAGQHFGFLWQGAKTDPEKLEDVWGWCASFRKKLPALEGTLGASVGESLRRLASGSAERLTESAPARRAIEDFLMCLKDWESAESRLEETLSFEAGFWGDPTEHGKRLQQLEKWSSRTDDLKDWCRWRRAANQARLADLDPLIARVEEGTLEAPSLLRAFDRAVRQQWYEQQQDRSDALRYFRGSDHEGVIAGFQALEIDAKEAARREIQARLAAKLPNPNAAGQMAVLRQEFKKQRRHKSLRKLYYEAPDVMMSLKPCVLMSPLSAAMYLDPSLALFDLVIFDEASQIPPWDAIGALGRAKQAIVVGDSKQLPPTSFFSVADSEEDLLDEDLVDMESILDHCISQGMRQLTLNWHYRSRHESLIAFSNHHYYSNRLHVFPAAQNDVPRLGVKWRHVKEGFYDRGGSRTNKAEAREVVDEVIRRLTSNDTTVRHKTIGIVTFSSAQQRCIEDLLDEARQKHPDIEKFFTGDEPLFVKNLESVQGDERDVMLFSIAYGPDQTGKVSMNFGPLNRKGGERRLNVAVTRARELLVVFSTLTPEHINLSATAAVGAQHLKTFLDYARRGPQALAASISLHSERGFESPLEEEIAAAIEQAGWEVHPQVGVAGYRIDLGVVDPEMPGAYILGVECDGASYHSAKTARDRDRIRQSVLEGLGWTIHRVWSTDWWHNRERETEKLLAAIEEARRAAEVREMVSTLDDHSSTFVPKAEDIPSLDRDDVFGVNAPTSWPDYTEKWKGWPDIGLLGEKDQFYNASSKGQIVHSLNRIVELCAPISTELAAKFVVYAWGFKQASNKATGRVLELLPISNVRKENDTLWPKVVAPNGGPFFRYVEEGGEARDFSEIPNSELDSALAWIVNEAVALSEEDAIREVARVFGASRTGKTIQDVVYASIERLARQGVLAIESDGTLTAKK